MSALRINVPGQPVVLVDQGPANGTAGRFHLGGVLVTPQKAAPLILPATSQATRDRMAAYKRSRVALVTCGRAMHTGHACARPDGHGTGCMSRTAMDRNAERRRAR